MRLAVVDFECTSLKSDQGFLLCGGFKPLGKPGYVIDLATTGCAKDRLRIDKHLVVAIRNEMDKYDGWITWNGLLFDLPFLDDRLIFCEEKKREPRFARGLDVMWHAAMGKSRFTSRRLDWVAKVLGCPFKKTDLDLNRWKEAEAEAIRYFRKGKSSFKYIVDHCKADLEVTEWVYEKLKGRIQTISKK